MKLSGIGLEAALLHPCQLPGRDRFSLFTMVWFDLTFWEL
jgi:hypothetical protein